MSDAIKDAERTILGAILIDNRAMSTAALTAHDFADPVHRAIFAAMHAIDERAQPIDLVTVRHELGGRIPAAEIAALVDGLPRIENVAPWAKLVRAASQNRQLREALTIAAEKADPDEQIAAALRAIESNDVRARDHTVPIYTAAKAAFDSFEQLAGAKGMIGRPTGFGQLDAILSGLNNGELIVVAGRPGMGKSALAVQMARGSSARCLIVSLEMSQKQIARRMISSAAQVNQRAIQFGLREHQWQALAKAAADVCGLPMWINTSANTVGGIRRAARTIPNLELIVVDYLQLMEGKGPNRQEAVASISRGLKQLAVDLQVPIIALSQLSRPADTRKDKRPQLTDLRESGAIEQDADVVILIYREEAHNPTDANKGRAEIIVAKQREGDTNTVRLNWDKTTTRFFEDQEPEQESML